MKLLVLFLILTSQSSWGMSDALNDGKDNTYEHGLLPNLLPFVGQALSGRCYQTSGPVKKAASVLMVSFEEDGFEIALFDANGRHEDFFDKMTYENIIKKFPIIKTMFLGAIETADGVVVEDEKTPNIFKGELRESEKYMILRAYRNNELYKICNYNKF